MTIIDAPLTVLLGAGLVGGIATVVLTRQRNAFRVDRQFSRCTLFLFLTGLENRG